MLPYCGLSRPTQAARKEELPLEERAGISEGPTPSLRRLRLPLRRIPIRHQETAAKVPDAQEIRAFDISAR